MLAFLAQPSQEDNQQRTEAAMRQFYPNFVSYQNLKSSAHILTFSSVESTMPIAADFPHKEAYHQDGFLLAFTAYE